ncbi:MAG: ornithine cyclodeaminase family protein, partial [Acidimicrobiales bacterium]|nr:ornithine cyclodeaminase family protein [Acidimicrobiales bacterium]
LEDLVVAELALDHARRMNIGLHTQLQNAPIDPYSPYDGLSF